MLKMLINYRQDLRYHLKEKLKSRYAPGFDVGLPRSFLAHTVSLKLK